MYPIEKHLVFHGVSRCLLLQCSTSFTVPYHVWKRRQVHCRCLFLYFKFRSERKRVFFKLQINRSSSYNVKHLTNEGDTHTTTHTHRATDYSTRRAARAEVFFCRGYSTAYRPHLSRPSAGARSRLRQLSTRRSRCTRLRVRAVAPLALHVGMSTVELHDYIIVLCSPRLYMMDLLQSTCTNKSLLLQVVSALSHAQSIKKHVNEKCKCHQIFIFSISGKVALTGLLSCSREHCCGGRWSILHFVVLQEARRL